MPTPYDCSKCPAYCCSYERIDVTDHDIERLATYLNIDVETFTRRFTKIRQGARVLRHQRDNIFKSVCVFLDRKTRRCTVYPARPRVCRTYPDRPRCGYWEFLSWEREFQGDPDFVPLQRL